MAIPISSSNSAATAISTLLRTQSTSVSAQKAPKAVVDQLRTTVVANNTAPVQQTSGGSSLPRGSLIDITV